MEEAVPTKASGDNSRGNLLLFAAGGIGIYIILKTLDPAIAFPLRYISTAVATVLLNALSLPATREGTTISTADYTFDVNPDCSGSTSLRIMLTLGALWFGMYPNLTLGRRLLCLLFAAPVAVLCNAVRVTTLVLLGDRRGAPVEGLPHELIGILAFALAMAIVYFMTLLMAKEPTVRERSGPRAHLAFLAFGLLVSYAPVLWGVWFLAPDPVVGAGHLGFVVAGLGLLLFALWGRSAGRSVPSWIPVALVVAAMGLLASGTMTDIITFSSFSLVLALFGVVVYFRGWRGAFAVTPLLGVLFVGLPSLLHGAIVKLTERLASGDASFQLALLVETLLVAALISGFLWATRRRPDSAGREPAAAPSVSWTQLTAVPMKALILLSFLGVLFQTWFNSGTAKFDERRILDIPVVLGAWQGTERQPTAREVEVYGRSGVLSRIYRRPDTQPVHLLISSTGAKRKNTHHPMECMQALGWKVLDRENLEHTGPNGTMPMTKLLLARGDAKLEMRFWFDGGDGKSYLSYRDVYLADITRRLFGRRTDWRVYRLYTEPGAKGIEDFVDELVR